MDQAVKKPLWPKVVGVIGILLGLCGILMGGKTIMTPGVLQTLEKAMPEYEKMVFEKIQDEEAAAQLIEQVRQLWESLPPWFDTWCLVMAILGLLVSGFFIYVCVNLFRIKETAIKTFYLAVGIMIGFAALKTAILSLTIPILGMVLSIPSVFGIIINLILLGIVAFANKKAFKPAQPTLRPDVS